MTIHAPCALKGPVTREHPWWARPQRRAKSRRRTGVSGIRADLVARVRGEIEAGTYDTPERWETALDRLCDSLTGR